MSDVLRNDYSPLLSLNVDLPPIGVKFSFFRPNNIAPLEKSVEMSLCEILIRRRSITSLSIFPGRTQKPVSVR